VAINPPAIFGNDSGLKIFSHRQVYKMPVSPSFTVEFTVKVSYDNRHYAKELRCRWSPDDKKWKKSFTTVGEYGYRFPERMHDAMTTFIEQCHNRGVQFEFDEDDYNEFIDHIKSRAKAKADSDRAFYLRMIKEDEDEKKNRCKIVDE
jgi:hypothetical protein